MTTVNGLQHKVNSLIDQASAQLPHTDEQHAIIFDLSIFPEHEQGQLQAFLATLPDPLYLHDLADSQFYQIGCWIYLEAALINGDGQEASIQRERIHTSDETLTATFLALDLAMLPSDVNAPGIHEDNYSYSRSGHRNIVLNRIQRENPLRMDTRNDLWRWIHFYQQKGWQR